ncbi:unnamed protein product [Trichobilharzia szidati]|nr:unnamed protein product [Trichobilharzia szidati]
MDPNSSENFDWVELVDHKTQQLMYINLKSGACFRDPPKNAKVKAASPNQWWELFDPNAQRNYYYNSSTRETIWQKPSDGEIIPLAKIQQLQQNLRPSFTLQNDDIGIFRRSGHSNNNTSHMNINPDHNGERLSTSSLSQRKSTNNPSIVDNISGHTFNYMLPMPHSNTTTNGNHQNMNGIQSPLLSSRSIVDNTTTVHQFTTPVTIPTTTISNDHQRVHEWLRDSSMNITINNNGSNIDHNTRSSIKKPNCLSDRPIRRHSNIQPSQLQELIEFPSPIEEHFSHLQLKSTSHTVNYSTQFSNPSVSSKYFSNDLSFIPSEFNNRSIKGYTIDNSTPQLTPRQRAFPRTNPTVSRPSGSTTCTLPRPTTTTASSDNSLKPILPASIVSSNHQVNDTNSTRTTPIMIDIIDWRETSSASASFNNKPKLTQHQQPQHLPVDSPLSASPQPSSSSPPISPTSFSSASSSTTTALTTANSDESIDDDNLPNVLLENSETPSHQHQSYSPENTTTTTTAAYLFNNDSQDYSQYICILNEDDEQLKPPTPPPRSASTLCSQGISVANDFFGSFSNHIPLEIPSSAVITTAAMSTMMTTPATPVSLHHPHQTIEYSQTYYPPVCLQSPVTPSSNISPIITSSSLTRNHPLRANVIQPNHRRPHRSQYFTQHIQTGISDEKTTKSNENNFTTTPAAAPPTATAVDDGGVNCFISTSELLFNTQQPRILLANQVNTTRTRNVTAAIPLPDVGVSSSGSGNIWSNNNNKLTAKVWGDSSNNSNSNHSNLTTTTDSVHIIEYGKITTGTNESITGKAFSTSNLIMNNLPRSSSGGFIGPAESTDSSLLRTSGSYNHHNNNNNSINHSNNNNNRSRVLSICKTIQPIYVHPGHPGFSLFIEPFNWPSHLFKPDADISTLMSWTKSNFSKRLLVNSEPALKKQVAQLFKVIQSFMGDRKARLSLPDYGSIIIHRALSSANLRDELYAQLCKQTTGNTDIKSLTNGWALLCVCLYYFPPNSKFRDHLYAYLQNRSEASVILNHSTPNTSNHTTITTSTTVTATTTMTNNNNATSSGTVEYNTQSALPMESSLKAAAAIAAGLNPFHFTNNYISSSNNDNVKLVDKCQQSNDASMNNIYSNHVNNYPAGITLGPWDRPTAAHFARVAPRWFARSLNVGVRKTTVSPSIEEICHVKDFLLKPCIFGSSLDEMMQIQAYRFPYLRIPWIQIFLTEEILHLNGAQTEGIFRLSPDMDVLIEVRCQLEKLFEIFRVVQLCDPEQQQQQQNNDEYDMMMNSRFLVHRPPPPGWSTSVQVIEAEDENHQDNYPDATSSASCLDWNCLIGEFTWPLLPEPLSLPPAEYVLLTPTAYWPRNLSSIIRRSRSTSLTSSSSMAAAAVSVSASTTALTTGAGGGSGSGGNSGNMESHLAAGLLKLWLRELSQPLIPIELQSICMKAACEAEVYETQEKNDTAECLNEEELNPIQKCCRLVRRLHPLPRRSLLYLILLLQHLSKPINSNKSLMDARNLSTVIAPNLMRSSSNHSQDPRELLQNVRPQTLFIRLLISYLDVEAEVKYLKQEEEAAAEAEAQAEEQRDEGASGVDGGGVGGIINGNGNEKIIKNKNILEDKAASEGRRPLPGGNHTSHHDKLSSTSSNGGYVYLSAPVRVKLGPNNAFIPL